MASEIEQTRMAELEKLLAEKEKEVERLSDKVHQMSKQTEKDKGNCQIIIYYCITLI